MIPVLLIIGVLWACSKTNASVSEKITEAIGLIAKKHSIDTILTGDITIRVNSKTNEILITHQQSGLPEVKTAYAFSLQNSIELSDNLIHLENAKIYDFKDGGTLFVISGDGDLLYSFAVSTDIYKGRADEINRNLKGLVKELNTYEGYELVRLKGDWKQDINTAKMQSIYSLLSTNNLNPKVFKQREITLNLLDPTCPTGQTYISCTSGGVGATQCSVDDPMYNCSVTCASGYVACCNDARTVCKCVVLIPNHNGGCANLQN